MLILAGFSPEAFASSVTVPGLSPLFTIAVAAPLKRSISGLLKSRSDVASPLAVARNVPSPVTLNFTVGSASGTMLPSLSATLTVM